MIDILPITAENIEQAYQRAMSSAEYGPDFDLMKGVISDYPGNGEFAIVAMKIGVIDVINNTNLGKYRKKITLDELARAIVCIRDFDNRLRDGDPELVTEIARSNGKINLFSFASKYCCYHQQAIYDGDDYSIYDSVLAGMLPCYKPGLTKAQIERWRTSYNYKAFNDCIGEILDDAGIDILNRRAKFDSFVWYSNR